jgi:6-pyruvoyl-tetrahydropterin synthase-like protein
MNPLPAVLARWRRPSLQTVISVIVVALAALFVFWQVRPDLLFANTTTAGGDTGAHVWGPSFLRNHLLPHGRITGWAPDWYDGFPAMTFYFPLPSLVIALLSFAMPYNVAFKLITVVGLIALPAAAYTFGRLSGMRFPGPPLFAIATLPFLFDRGFTIYGGNIPSTLAGEFSFSISLAVGLFFLGVLARGLDTGRHRALAAVLLALTGLSHILPTLFVLAGAVVLFLQGPLFGPRGRQRLRYVATVLPVGGLLAGFWALPIFFRTPYATDMGWEKLTKYLDNLGLQDKAPWLLALALVGAISAMVMRRRTGITLTALALIFAAVFRFAPQGRLWNARFLPFWYLCLYLLAAVAIAELAGAVGTLVARDPDRPSRIPSLAAPAVTLIAALVFVGMPLRASSSSAHALGLWRYLPLPTSHDQSFVPSWVKWNYSGYERKPAYPEYKRLIDTMSTLPCGRAHWEYEGNLDRYGTPMALMLLPYWTHGCIGSMEGLYFESSATTPFHFLNAAELSKAPSNPERNLPYKSLDVADGVRHLQLMGTRYYLAFSPDALAQAHANPDLRLVAVSKPWEIFEVANSAVVAPLHNQPAVLKGVPKGGTGWLDAAVRFYQSPDTWDVPLAASGPSGWQRIGLKKTPATVACPNDSSKKCPDKTVAAGVTIQQPLRIPVRAARVSRIRTQDDRISFDVDRPGSPVLVKTSYFPNWEASGARGPWRVTPNLMVVIPTSRHVSLHYGYTPVDRAGWAFTLVGVLLVIAFWRKGPLPFPEPEREGEQLQLFDAEMALIAGNGERVLAAEHPPP